MSFDSLVNKGDYFSAHYLAEVLPKDLKKKDGGLLARWTEEEKDGRTTPRKGLRALAKPYFADRPFFADLDDKIQAGEGLDPGDVTARRKGLNELHGEVLRALAYDPRPRDLVIERAGSDTGFTVPVAHADRHLVAIECGWAADVDAALDDELSGLLLSRVDDGTPAGITSATKLATWLFSAEEPPRYVLILAGGVVVLADRATWGEGRYLAANLDIALGRGNIAELETIAALFGADSLLPPEEGGAEPLAELLTNSRNHAVGVSKELRDGLKDSVELIANEVLDRIRAAGVRPQDVMEPGALARELGREALRYLYRVLFLLYAEARPELGILPTKDKDYVQGYSIARLGDLVVRDVVGEEARQGFHLYESLDLLFRMVNKGHRPRTGGETAEISGGEGLRFEPLRSDLFEPEAIRLIGRAAVDMPGYDEDDPGGPAVPKVDTRLRNETLHKVLRKLMLAKGRRKERGGFISYAQLGINQLGAVYEGLMSYTGFIATEELYEVAKNGDPKDGSWMIPASKADDYPDDVFVRATDEDGAKTDERVRYKQGAFVYRLAGRDRQTSASYYTPESLTQVTVQLALQHRLDQDGTTTTAREILDWKICEPALGSGAFLNEAINQMAAEYLKRRQDELDREIDPERYEEELQRVKAFIALHNAYGVDLNDTAIELAEVSVWLNVMHPGLQAPWFGLHLRRGNSLIGAGRRVYDAAQLTKGEWLKSAPEDMPFSAGAIPAGKVHHFLLPAEGWGAAAGAKEAKELAPEQAKQLATWRRQLRRNVSDKKTRGRSASQLERLQALSARAEYLWDLVIQRLTISEREISRKIDVWGADWISQPETAVPKEKVYGDLTAPGTPYWRLKKVMDAWCALWFWPLDKAGLLDGSDEIYAQPMVAEEKVVWPEPPAVEAASETVQLPLESSGFGARYTTDSIFDLGEPKQLGLDDAFDELRTAATVTGGGSEQAKTTRKRPTLKPLRPVIPLSSLDDWLDFAEAALGRTDIPEDSLGASFVSLADLEEHEDQLPAWMAMDSEMKLPERFPWLNSVDDLATQHGLFHWELQFAQIFNKNSFDLQVGNPPWVRPMWDEASVLAELDPWFRLSERIPVPTWRERRGEIIANCGSRRFILEEVATSAALADFLASPACYGLLVGAQPNLYRVFMIQLWRNMLHQGIVGLIHPGTHFGGSKEVALRRAAYCRLRFHAHFMNERCIFEDVGHTTEFGIHIYGAPGPIHFRQAAWLFEPQVLIDSLDHEGDGEIPGLKYNGNWDVRPHARRVITVTLDTLREWASLERDENLSIDEARLLYPITSAEQGAISTLAEIVERIGGREVGISSGYHEKGAKEKGLIRWKTADVNSWSDVVLQGPHISVATPFAKRPNIPCKSKGDYTPWNLLELGHNQIPITNYQRASSIETFIAAQDRWEGRKYTDFYRLAWRKMIPQNNERSLYSAIIPRGAAHIDGLYSMALRDNRETVMAAGFWSSLILDYILRITGRANLHGAEARSMPAANPGHILSSALILRTLRLNCLTGAYGQLWGELFDSKWSEECWAVEWINTKPLNDPAVIEPMWRRMTPLRTDYERRAALIEIDAIVAVWLGISVDELIAIYRSRYPILADRDMRTWFDANGRRIAADPFVFGYGQAKDHFEQLMAHLDSEINGPVPDGYTAPFYKADRESEYRQAHAAFSERLRQAEAAGWTPPSSTP